MSPPARYLKRNLAVEPLYNQWYAWWYLLSPATAPLFVQNLHLRLMQSFVQSPDIHVAALKNPALRGGPYLNYGVERVPEVKQLLERTLKDEAPSLRFAQAVVELEKLLASAPPAMSLEGLYKQVPDILRGYVELTYDLQNRPAVRFIEALLYKSPHYRESSQSLSFRLLSGDSRPYIFSTPRLGGDGTIQVHRPFRHEALDTLFAMRDTPGPVEPVREALGLTGEDARVFDTFFTDEPPPPRQPHASPGLRVRYFGHACVLLQTPRVSVMTDPVISYDTGNEVPRFTHADLPERIDYVLITHGHADHLMLETLLQLRSRIGTIVVPRCNGGALADPSLKLMLRHAGFRNVVELDEMETLEIPGGSLTGLPFLGEHSDLNILAKIAHLVELEGKTLLMAADSNAIEPRLYDNVRDALGKDIDVLFIGMESEGAPMSWMYGPLLSTPLPRKADQTRRLNGSNAERAINIVNRLKPKQVYIYAMGREPWLGHVMAFEYPESAPQLVESRKLLQHCRDQGITADMPFIKGELAFP